MGGSRRESEFCCSALKPGCYLSATHTEQGLQAPTFVEIQSPGFAICGETLSLGSVSENKKESVLEFCNAINAWKLDACVYMHKQNLRYIIKIP